MTLELVTDKRSCAESDSATNGSPCSRVAYCATYYPSHGSASECADACGLFACRQRTAGTTRKSYSPGNHQR
jgi:hypothetical protein